MDAAATPRQRRQARHLTQPPTSPDQPNTLLVNDTHTHRRVGELFHPTTRPESPTSQQQAGGAGSYAVHVTATHTM
jgi:hypothetical protein